MTLNSPPDFRCLAYWGKIFLVYICHVYMCVYITHQYTVHTANNKHVIVIQHGVCIVFICIQARTFISYERYWTRHSYEPFLHLKYVMFIYFGVMIPCAYLGPGIYVRPAFIQISTEYVLIVAHLSWNALYHHCNVPIPEHWFYWPLLLTLISFKFFVSTIWTRQYLLDRFYWHREVSLRHHAYVTVWVKTCLVCTCQYFEKQLPFWKFNLKIQPCYDIWVVHWA